MTCRDTSGSADRCNCWRRHFELCNQPFSNVTASTLASRLIRSSSFSNAIWRALLQCTPRSGQELRPLANTSAPDHGSYPSRADIAIQTHHAASCATCCATFLHNADGADANMGRNLLARRQHHVSSARKVPDRFHKDVSGHAGDIAVCARTISDHGPRDRIDAVELHKAQTYDQIQ